MMQDGYYAIIPATVISDRRISANEKLLLAEIIRKTLSTGKCWATTKYFADLFNVKSNAILVWLKNLENLGYIAREIEYVEETKCIKNRTITTIFTPTISKDCTIYKNTTPTISENSTPTISANTYNNINNKKTNNNIYNGTNDCLPFNDVPNLNREPCTGLEKKEKFIKRKKVSELSAETNAEFEKFWEEYPRKDAKQSALLIYGNLVESHKVTPQQLMDGLAKYVLVIKREKRERKYIAMPTTWLNQERWLDNADIKIPKKELNPNNLVCCGPRPVW